MSNGEPKQLSFRSKGHNGDENVKVQSGNGEPKQLSFRSKGHNGDENVKVQSGDGEKLEEAGKSKYRVQDKLDRRWLCVCVQKRERICHQQRREGTGQGNHPPTPPRGRSAAVSPKVQSTAGSPPKWHSISDGRFSLPGSLPTSKHSTAPNSPPHGGSHSARATRVDGKEFFRKARNRLSYEQFSAFLTNIKQLNAHLQTKEEALRKASEIFGPENEDLYHSFEGLLRRHLPSQG